MNIFDDHLIDVSIDTIKEQMNSFAVLDELCNGNLHPATLTDSVKNQLKQFASADILKGRVRPEEWLTPLLLRDSSIDYALFRHERPANISENPFVRYCPNIIDSYDHLSYLYEAIQQIEMHVMWANMRSFIYSDIKYDMFRFRKFMESYIRIIKTVESELKFRNLEMASLEEIQKGIDETTDEDEKRSIFVFYNLRNRLLTLYSILLGHLNDKKSYPFIPNEKELALEVMNRKPFESYLKGEKKSVICDIEGCDHDTIPLKEFQKKIGYEDPKSFSDFLKENEIKTIGDRREKKLISNCEINSFYFKSTKSTKTKK